MCRLHHKETERTEGRTSRVVDREEYLLYHESKDDLARADEFDNLPDECKHCTQLSCFNLCKLADYRVDAWDSDCPLEHLLCEDCQFYCEIVQKDGTKLDYGFCSEKEHELEFQERACQGFTPYEKGNK